MISATECVTFEEAILAVPDAKFENLTGSTIPLLSYWRRSHYAARYLYRGLGFKRPAEYKLFFEYAIPALTSDDDPFCTDAMLVSKESVIAVESSWMEPPCDTVTEWLAKGNRARRQKTLNRWIGYIQPFSRTELKAENMGDMVCRSLYLVAAACAVPAEQHAVVYQEFFTPGIKRAQECPNYIRDLELLNERIRPNNNLKIIEQMFILAKNRNHEFLERKLQTVAKDKIPALIRYAIEKRNLFTFTPLGTCEWRT
jgi:hypothetical protein